jgi:hypothetical protein
VKTAQRSAELYAGAAALIAEQDQVCATANTEFSQQIGNVELYGPLGDMQAVCDLFIGQIFQQASENFLFAAAQFGRGIAAQSAALSGT